MAANTHEGLYQGEKAVWLEAGPYEAAVLPEIGANLIAFRDTVKQYRFLHEPTAEEMESFKAKPVIHGIPVLFPPNRYEDGKFPWNGKVYSFPVNEPSTGNHLHGFLHYIPWAVESRSNSETEARVTLVQQVTESHPVYAYFPHAFTIRLHYTLSAAGLQQQVTIRNDGKDAMPCLLAFHTSINAPFAEGSTASDCMFTMTIGQRWELSGRMLPTGRFQPLKPEEERMQRGGVSPYFEAMDNHYTAVPQNGRNRMELTDTRLNVKLVYDVGTAYKQWMIWNNNAGGRFFCPEPQVNLVNAPNVQLPAEEIGLHALEPGAIWEASSRLYTIEA
ncbi:aldose 1-epimerase [Paenibacillus allorhizosphaerae]|uniref:Aldose 1-epimerase n=1 Tax=Paenibacillus allorhizosphaerae TaxID=2849866 RepID=A0ABM8VLJ3_9BACL|nr:aldose 1-epimerase [Paenibacillus allorhizosphaerae]CAG7648675.1 Aldose 1-epimerase [Paenibacillus allorhizosphaerae]